jgi:signal transduction histidine kinase
VCREQRILGLANHTALVTREGRIVPVEDSASPIMNAAGQMTGVVLVFHDVTERRRAEEAQARLASFPRLNPNPIVEADVAGQVHYCNPAAEQMFPNLVEQGADHPWLANWEEMTGIFQSAESQETVREISIGDVCFLQTMHYVPEFQRLRIYGLDITGRKQAEVELQRVAADLERSNEELEQFAYVASHDLQEPLRAVIGYVNLLESRLHDQLDDKSRQHLDGALQGAARMHQLITDLLALSRVGSQGKPFVETDLNPVFELTLQYIRTSVQETEAIITHDPLPTMCVDADQLAQLFQNLLANAIKFRNDQPPEIHISAQQQADRWLFSVRDNGIGLDPQNSERIFQIFQRLHTRAKYPGTGIGLAICKKIVERHGGKIWVESQPGEGATFYFTIPC